MTKPLPHAEIIKHMAEHGFESVEGWMPDAAKEVLTACASINPVNSPHWHWRIKPDTIMVEIPRPLGLWAEYRNGSPVIYMQYNNISESDPAIVNIKKAMGM